MLTTHQVGASEPPAGAGPGPACVLPPGAAPRSPGRPWKLRVESTAGPVTQRLAGADGCAGGRGCNMDSNSLYYFLDANILKA
ncbi:hypothetical protein PAL_GLEAN10012152 [Pteropus alecto]|uniref:Uncharacterized protein n=1 Tax=Pteropus alecto TaxID=9402 RepID=L5KBK8_PTEAL|nr:hypothetical protein PAL_GLEAN10012152 [Pteropus alecto]